MEKQLKDDLMQCIRHDWYWKAYIHASRWDELEEWVKFYKERHGHEARRFWDDDDRQIYRMLRNATFGLGMRGR